MCYTYMLSTEKADGMPYLSTYGMGGATPILFRMNVECRVSDVMSYMYTCGMALAMTLFILVHVCVYTLGMNVALPRMQSKNQLNSYNHI